MWIDQFTIALAEENVERISELILDVPIFESVAEMEEALYLIKEADRLMQRFQQENLLIKSKLKKHIAFIKSTHSDIPSTLDTSH